MSPKKPEQDEVDPTANVVRQFDDAVKRSDDLRTADQRYNDLQSRRHDDLREMESRHRIDMDSQRMRYEDKVEAAEARRVDTVLIALDRANQQVGSLGREVGELREGRSAQAGIRTGWAAAAAVITLVIALAVYFGLKP